MLTELMRHQLKRKMFTPEEIDSIDSYDDRTGTAIFKDGTERTVVTCITRIMGYLREVDNFNNGKQSEYKERVWFTEANANPQRCPCTKAA